VPAEYKHNPEDSGNWVLQQQAFPLIYLPTEPCRNIGCPADDVAFCVLSQCARPNYTSEVVFAVINILLQVSCFIALPYTSSASRSHFTCPARPCFCKVAGEASCSTIYSLSSLNSFYYSLYGIKKFDYADLEFETGHWGREITLCEVTKNNIHGTRISILKVLCRRSACLCSTASEQLDQNAHKVAVPLMKLTVVSYVNMDTAVELIRFYSSFFLLNQQSEY